MCGERLLEGARSLGVPLVVDARQRNALLAVVVSVNVVSTGNFEQLGSAGVVVVESLLHPLLLLLDDVYFAFLRKRVQLLFGSD